MIIQSEKWKQDNVSDDNSGSSPVSPIEKFVAHGDFIDEVYNSKDNQEILNDIMGLQRFQATLDQDQKDLRRPNEQIDRTQKQDQDKDSPIKLKDVKESNEFPEQNSQDQRWESSNALVQ